MTITAEAQQKFDQFFEYVLKNCSTHSGEVIFQVECDAETKEIKNVTPIFSAGKPARLSVMTAQGFTPLCKACGDSLGFNFRDGSEKTLGMSDKI